MQLPRFHTTAPSLQLLHKLGLHLRHLIGLLHPMRVDRLVQFHDLVPIADLPLVHLPHLLPVCGRLCTLHAYLVLHPAGELCLHLVQHGLDRLHV